MTLHEISKIAKEGDKIRRTRWEMYYYLVWPIAFKNFIIPIEDVVADDWEIVKKKVQRHEEMTLIDFYRQCINKFPAIPGHAKVSIDWEEEE